MTIPEPEAKRLEPIRRAIATIRKHMGGMTPNQKLIITLLAVIGVMAFVLVTVWSSATTMKELMPSATAEDQVKAVPLLNANGIKFENRDGKLYVPEGQKDRAWALIAQSGQQPSNSSVVFENIIKSQNWINSKEQNRQIYKVMLDNWLSGVIGKFDGVKSAKVFVDAPEPTGIGQAARPAKASITIFTESGKPLSQPTVDAAARMVAGSVAGLDVSRVNVTDGAGRPRKVTDDSELASGTYRENAAALEKQFRDKIYNLVRYIDGVVVEVTATVDVTKSRSSILKNFPVGQGSVAVPKKESSTGNTQTDASTAAEPGLRSNQRTEIASASGSQGSKNEQKTEDTEFTVGLGTENKQVDDPGGMPTRLVATVAVPRGFILALLQKEAAEAAGGSDAKDKTAPVISADDVNKRFAAEELSIKKALAPHVKTRAPDGQMVEGEVEVTLVSGESFILASGAGAAGATAGVGGGIGSVLALGGGLVDKVVLGGLALFAVGMMLMMVRRAGKRVEVPSAEELVGAPPQLQTRDDVVGEADESETPIVGIELGEDLIRADKIREQVAELVKSSPDVAARMVNRWMSVEE